MEITREQIPNLYLNNKHIETIAKNIESNFIEETNIEDLNTPESYYNTQIVKKALGYKSPLEVFEEFINTKGKVTAQDFLDIKLKHPSVIAICSEYIRQKAKNTSFVNSKPEDVAKIIVALKKGFDNKYGKNNYRIISIGTSPAVLAEGLKNIGADVAFMPISCLRDCEAVGDIPLEVAVDRASKYRNLKTALKYLKQQGVSSRQTEKDGKVNILFDYSSTGGTLFKISNILQNSAETKIPKEYLKIESLGNAIMKSFGCESEENKKIADIFMSDVFFEAAEMVGNVPHFMACADTKKNWRSVNPETYIKSMTASKKKEDIKNDEERIFKEFDEYSAREARAYQLLILDSIYDNLCNFI